MIAIFDVRVRLDLRGAGKWLDEQQSGLSLELSTELHRLVDSIEFNPLQFSPWPGSRHQDQVRFSLIGKFGYVLVFKVLAERRLVLILSAQRGRQRPGAWKFRLKTFRPEGQ